MNGNVERLQPMKAFIGNMDGVIFHEEHSLSDALSFVKHVNSEPKHVLFFTNNSHPSLGEFRETLLRLGVDIDESHLHASALTIVEFLAQQASSNHAVFVIGEANFLQALYDADSLSDESTADYIVLGFAGEYNFGVSPMVPSQAAGLPGLAKRCGRGPGQGFYRR